MLVGADAQAHGGALTYARRYSLAAAFGVCPEDDDGNTACLNVKMKKEEAQEEGTLEVKKLGASELRKLAARVSNTLMGDEGLHCAISEDEMFEYLAHYQKFKVLQPAIDEALENNRIPLLNSFIKWQNSKAA